MITTDEGVGARIIGAGPKGVLKAMGMTEDENLGAATRTLTRGVDGVRLIGVTLAGRESIMVRTKLLQKRDGGMKIGTT